METQAAEIASLPGGAEVDSEATNDKTDGSAPSAAETGAANDQGEGARNPDKQRDSVNERFDKLTRDLYELRGERDRDRYEIESRNRRIQELEAQLQTAKPSQVAPDKFPTLEEHGYDEGKFQAAVAAHIAKITREQGTEAAREALRAEREAEAARRAGETWAAKAAEFSKAKPDFQDKVLRAPTLPVTHELQQILRGHEQGPEILYHMVENRDAALAIARLPLPAQLMEVGRIAERIAAAKAAPKPPVSQAPPPPAKLDTAASAPSSISTTSPESDKLSDDDWVKAERARLARKARRQANG